MLDAVSALPIAELILDQKVRPWVDEPVSIVRDQTVEAPRAIVFFYNTIAYLETKSAVHALAGNGPIIVERSSGRAWIADSSRPWEHQVDDG